MALTEEQVRQIAHLARIGLEDTAVSDMARELGGVLDLVEQMNAVNTREVPPMAHPLNAMQRLREDKVSESDQRDQLQQGAPAVEAGLYLVPRVIE